MAITFTINAMADDVYGANICKGQVYECLLARIELVVSSPSYFLFLSIYVHREHNVIPAAILAYIFVHWKRYMLKR